MRCIGYDDSVMRDLAVLLIDLIVTVARLFEPGVAEDSGVSGLLTAAAVRGFQAPAHGGCEHSIEAFRR